MWLFLSINEVVFILINFYKFGKRGLLFNELFFVFIIVKKIKIKLLYILI